MAISVEAIYEHGVLRPVQPLDLREHEKVHITVERAATTEPVAGVVQCRDSALIEWAASDADLDFPVSHKAP